MNPKIVFTGLGAVCGAGLKIDAIWDAILTGKSGVKEISSWDVSGWPLRMAAEVTGVDNRTLVEDRKLHKMISRTDLFGLYAANCAMQQSGLLAYRESLEASAAVQFSDRSGIFVGSGAANYTCTHDFFPALAAVEGDLKKFGGQFGDSVNPMWLLRNLPNNVLCHVGIRYNFKGANACVTNHCVSGVLALAEAAAAIRAGEADRAIAVGHDTPCEPECVLHFIRLGLMAPDAVRSFDRDRAGTIFGEGAAGVVLEKSADAQARNAVILGEFLGSGCASEATGVLRIRPDGDGVRRAIELTLADAGITPAQVGMIVAHGNGTPASDASEASALLKIFGEAMPPVTGFKWAYGHLIAASGIVDLVFALMALRDKVVPGIPTLKTLDPELAPLAVSAAPQTPRSDIALVLCRGFGGMNVASLVRAHP
ncbi:MAG TPA: beta-ketoacyl synthase N-terminal-like domain-containing protein [Verrucomicrobiae bacterium]|nr:beta-ketoacyl synthase N-terminal-like domain-containing protein [Verrucomicrobiae bacterium]